MKKFICFLRDKTAVVFTWFVFLIVILNLLTGKKEVDTGFLIKTFTVSFVMVIFFYMSFSRAVIKKKGFIFRMNLFLTFTVCAEILLIIKFGFLGIQWRKEWFIFAVIVLGLYCSSIGIYSLYSKKVGKEYTNLLNQYQQNRKKEM